MINSFDTIKPEFRTLGSICLFQVIDLLCIALKFRIHIYLYTYILSYTNICIIYSSSNYCDIIHALYMSIYLISYMYISLNIENINNNNVPVN